MPELHTLDATALLALIRRRFAGSRPERGEDALRVGPFPVEVTRRLRPLFPANPTPAAVLVPIVDRGERLTVLLTERSTGLKHHAGQVSFPGGRLEPGDRGPVEGALRETEEEIGLPRDAVEVVGFLPDHLIISGYQVTPVIGLVRPDVPLALDATEVAGAFEVPLHYLFDPASRIVRRRRVAGSDLEYDASEVAWEGRTIWGATAGMLFTLRQLLEETVR